MDWFAERDIQRGDPSTVLDTYLKQKRQQISVTLKIGGLTPELNL
jgi:hypothetical protein